MLYSLRFQARDLSVQFCTTAMSRGERKRGGADRRTKSPGNGRVEEREKVKREEGKREITEYIGQRRRERKRGRSIGDGLVIGIFAVVCKGRSLFLDSCRSVQ